ncbi:fatty acid synthase-like [Diabrotica virgifera virgifera]|uniref:Fatty acid synthase n=2 Tax=Diabrotica virgifera virgifera TaxID=50390 RepID=A0ABM5K146_DIAVI|nr:fatty acid synthase-like [Diabrotica virgifera virgifera]XP_050503913.1 fatty acid synthase-like [Diabrotica virgifera virgifera]
MADGEDIVISGVSGRFPECHNIDEFKEALLSNKVLLTEDERRFPRAYKDVPYTTGKVPDIEKFDATFFEIHSTQANFMDPRQRILMEVVYEAIIDAGYNPKELRGSNTGVFIAVAMLNSKALPKDANEYYYIVNNPYHTANRISFYFDFKGPSFAMDSACSGSLYAFSTAYQKLKAGEIDSAIVGGTNINFNAREAAELNQLGVLMKEGPCKIFGKDRAGFNRSEAVCAYLLQKKKNSRKIYATVLGAGANIDGYKSNGITHPSHEIQTTLIKDIYKKSNINPDDVAYFEMHATGTVVGDLVECESIADIFRGNRPKPLLVGSVKSNVGHAESASGVTSLAKLIIAMQSGIIPATINTEPADPKILAIGKDTFEMVKKNTEYKDGLMAASSFGICGANAHVVLKPSPLVKHVTKTDAKFDRLVQVSGRTENGINRILDEIERNADDDEFLSLLDEVFKQNVDGFEYRGYVVLGKDKQPLRESAQCTSTKRPIWFIFSGLGSQWTGMARDLMHIDVFKNTFNRCATAIEPYGVDLHKIIMDDTPNSLKDITNIFSSISAVTVALVDVLTSVGIKPDFIAGHSMGEIGCGYANGGLTPEQAVLLAYARGYATRQTTLPAGLMAAVGISLEKLQDILPKDIYIACINNSDGITISGPEKSIREFVDTLTQQGIFARIVETGNIAFHSPYLSDAPKHLLNFIKNLIKNPKKRAENWISTSVPSEKCNETWAQYDCAEYHVNNYQNTVHFNSIYQHIHKNAIVVEISPHGLLTSVMKRELRSENTLIRLMDRTAKDQTQHLLSAIGKIFMAGGQPDLKSLYPRPSFPLTRGTKFLSSIIEWDHTAKWDCPNPRKQDYFGTPVLVNLSDPKYSYLADHLIDGRSIMPAAGYLVLLWTVLADMQMMDITEIPVIFENIKLLRAVVLTEENNVEFVFNVMRKSGNFEIYEGGTVVVTGKIRTPTDVSSEFIYKDFDKIRHKSDAELELETTDVYKEFLMRRYHYRNLFKSILKCNLDGTAGKVSWNENFTSFIDCIMQLKILNFKDRYALNVPVSIKKLVIDPNIHYEDVKKNDNAVYVHHDQYCNIVRTKGIEVMGIKFSTAPRRKNIQQGEEFENIAFVKYISPENKKYNLDQSLAIALNIVLQNMFGFIKNVIVRELKTEDSKVPNEIQVKTELYYSKKVFVVSEYSSIKPNNIDSKIDLLILDYRMIEKYREYFRTLKEDAFILCIGNLENTKINEFEVIFQTASLSLLRLKQDPITYDEIIQIRENDYKWLETIKTVSKSITSKNVLLYSENDYMNGIVGLNYCLMSEDDIKVAFRSVLVNQIAPPFSIGNSYYTNQLSKNLAFNILQDNEWGTFVPIAAEPVKPRVVENAGLTIFKPGDLSTLGWTETRKSRSRIDEANIVDTCYFAVNYKDVMISSGRLKCDSQFIGIEYSGITKTGKRVMGLLFGGFKFQVKSDPMFTWTIPDSWTLKEAATVPVTYITCYLAMIVRGKMEQNRSILIHAGAGGVGISAINIALSLNSTIFVTVGSEKKKQFLRDLFPQLKGENIGNSRDTSFYNLVKQRTNGKGVDFVLNSLSGELFQMSVECLANEGSFLEIGKVDLLMGSSIDTGIYLDNCSFHGVMVDKLYNSTELKKQLHKLIQDGIDDGVVKPLPLKIFELEEIESAFRYLASGKNEGKVVVNMRKDGSSKPISVPAIPQIFFYPEKVYIIVGGLGGMGLELAHWLFSRGARIIILNGRRNIWSKYQKLSMNIWESLKYKAIIDLSDTTTMAGAENLLLEAQNYGPVGGIFNVALVLRDAPVYQQTTQMFEDVCRPKISSSKNMDVLTRKMCPQLDHFVMFSSVVASRGVMGQTNYGYANSALERLCERRKRDKLPGLAIEWGPVADVGVLVTEKFNTKSFGNLLHQKPESCWKALEQFMILGAATCMSCVYKNNQEEAKKEKTPIDIVANILGIANIDTVDKHKPFNNFGVDSLMASEIKQILYQEFNKVIEVEDVRKLNFEKLSEFLDSEKK